MNKYLFTITTGRSGTAYLTQFLAENVPASLCAHERNLYKDWGEHHPEISHMLRFNHEGVYQDLIYFWLHKFQLLYKELDGQYNFYAETSHILFKAGLIENLFRLSGEKHVVILKRDTKELLQSFHNKFDFLNVGNIWMYYLDPDYPKNILKPIIVEGYEVECIRLWYIYEVWARAERYKKQYSDIIKFHEISLKDLTDKDKAKAFLRELGYEKNDVVLPPKQNESRCFIPMDEKTWEVIDNLIQQYDLLVHGTAWGR